MANRHRPSTSIARCAKTDVFLGHWLSAKPIRQWLRLSRPCRPRRQRLNTPTRRRYLARPTGWLNTRRIWAHRTPCDAHHRCPIHLRDAHFIASLPHRSRGPSASTRHCLDTENISTKYLLRLFRFKRLAANHRNEICSNQRDCNDEDDDRRECVNRWINALRHRIDEDRNILYAIARHEI